MSNFNTKKAIKIYYDMTIDYKITDNIVKRLQKKGDKIIIHSNNGIFTKKITN